MRAALLTVLLTSALTAAVHDLVASPDGTALYFRAQTAPTVTQTFVIHEGTPPRQADFSPVDIAAPAGAVLASTWYAARVCGTAGSTCFLAPPCQAGFTIRDTRAAKPDVASSANRSSFVRLDPTGTYAWIEQADPADCRGMGPIPGTSLNGLYTIGGATQIAPASAAQLANRRIGRRAIAAGPRALTFRDGVQLQWTTSSPAPPLTIRHTASAYEAVTDAAGRNAVYVEAQVGRLHWLDFSSRPEGVDTTLELTGSAPALTADGQTLVFFGPDNALIAWHKPTQSARRLGAENYTTFTLSDTAVFAATTDNRILRFNLTTTTESTVLEPFPEITGIDVPPLGLYPSGSCAIYCYGTPDPGYILSPGMLLQVRGVNLDRVGWNLSLEGAPSPAPPTSNRPDTAWTQIPNATIRTGNTQKLTLVSANWPAMVQTVVQVQPQVAVCLGTIHQDYAHLVTDADPAVPGEIVHIFLTGLGAAAGISDRQPNPSDRLVPLANPPAINPAYPDTTPVFFGLAPGLIGIQQIDLRIGFLIPARQLADYSLFTGINQKNCQIPPLATAN